MTQSITQTNENADLLRRAVGFINVALRHRWLVIGVPVIATAISVSMSLQQRRTFTAQARFMAQGARAAAGGAGLAAQLGLNVGGTGVDLSQTPEFYTDLLTSRPVLERTAHAKYTIAVPGQPQREQTLSEFYGGDDPAVDRLRGSIGSTIAPKTGIVTFSVRAPTPQLAQAIAQELLRQVDEFNRQRRQSRGMAERRFTEQRLAAADSELRNAENTLQAFYDRNRGFERSPELKAQEERLTREVARRTQVDASLSQAYEQAKIEEVRDTPVITVLEDPRLPTIGNARGTVSRAGVVFAVALVLCLIFAFATEMIRGARLQSMDEFAEFKSLGGELLADVKNPGRVFRRRSAMARQN